MAFKVKIKYEKSLRSPKDLPTTFSGFLDFDRVIPATFPRLEKFERIDTNRFRWLFKKLSYGGIDIQIKLVTKVEHRTNTAIDIISEPGDDLSDIKATWTFKPANQECDLTFTVDMDAQIPLPFFLKTVTAPLAQKEISRIFDRHLDNVAKALAA